MKYIFCLCFELSIPCGEYLFHGPTRLNFLVYSGLIKHLILALSFAFHAEGVLYHGTNKLEKYFIKKIKQLHSISHQIFLEATRFRLELLGFECSRWVAAHLWMQRKKWEEEWEEESEKPMKWVHYGRCGFRQWNKDTNEKKEKGERHWEWLRWTDLIETQHDSGSHISPKIYNKAPITQFS